MTGDPAPLNRAVRITTAVVGVTLAVAGFHHGVFEILQGNRPTPGLFINSIGPDHVRWEYGTDGAFTLLPSFLVTGLAAAGTSLAAIAWSLAGMPKRHGPTVFLGLFVLLTLVGGGIGHVPFFVAAWAWSTRIRAPLDGWRARSGPMTRAALSRGWIPSLVLSPLLFLIALELSVFGYPPLKGDPERLMRVIWSALIASLVLLNLAFAGAIIRDVERTD